MYKYKIIGDNGKHIVIDSEVDLGHHLSATSNFSEIREMWSVIFEIPQDIHSGVPCNDIERVNYTFLAEFLCNHEPTDNELLWMYNKLDSQDRVGVIVRIEKVKKIWEAWSSNEEDYVDDEDDGVTDDPDNLQFTTM